ncbi:CD151 antigen-like [Crassostrea virginica]|uniref:Tetraspanin n=1 Tax=Crassostrea virginica TaxID=6565 RepID=A0A8B8CUJ0_CRAVI|nr:CD82 antigen-like [Crassostrea virginica]XP_022317919.1 CD82 antigen-like [Crassostrea virginica]XP_022318893.1 CD82 antigen-like [Crassostrea virginica]XP_022318894.1 CD82 antigen-like [Crassostrea virginica]
MSFSRSEDDLGVFNEDKKRITVKSVARYALIFMLVAVMVASLTTFVVGVFTLEAEYGSRVVSGLVGEGMYQVDSLMMISAGAGAILVSTLGLLGVLCRNKCMLGLHLGILAFLSITLLVAGVLGYIFISELEDTAKKSMIDVITYKYGVNLNRNNKHDSITRSWDSVQRSFSCCGAYGGENSTTSWYIYRLSSYWYKDNFSNGSLVPQSCCAPSSDMDRCQGLVPSNAPPNQAPPVTIQPVNYTLYTTGCYDKLEGYIKQNGIIIGTAAIVTAVFMIVEMVLGIIVHRSS